MLGILLLKPCVFISLIFLLLSVGLWYLLPPEDLRAVLERLRTQAEGLELKERAALAARLLTEAAQARGLSLKLVKKP